MKVPNAEEVSLIADRIAHLELDFDRSVLRRYQASLEAIVSTKGFDAWLRTKDMRLEDWVIGKLQDHAVSDLLSGRFHVYRGVLDETGKEILKFLRAFLEVDRRRGRVSEDYVLKEILGPLELSLKNIG